MTRLQEKSVDGCLALYRYPYENAGMMVKGELEILRSYTSLTGRSGFVLAPFEISDKYPLLLIKPDEIESFDIKSEVDFHEIDFECRDEAVDFASYDHDFSKFHACLANGTFNKIVLSRRVTEIALDDIDPLLLFHRACSLYPRMFISLVHTPLWGTWLMATPEILIDNKQGRWHTMALAGTMKLGDETLFSELSDDEILTRVTDKWDDKSIREQAYVSSYISEILSPFASDMTVSKPHTIRAGRLFHIASDFYFTLAADKSLGDLIQELHPTPAVCGMPKRETYNFILRNEACERGYYSGFAGPLGLDGSTSLYVTLRCVNVEGRRYSLHAGGGLLNESESRAEWLETEAKMDTMRRCLAIRKT